eukprot:1498763-Pleurochrysis_carterae.AAC.2
MCEFRLRSQITASAFLDHAAGETPTRTRRTSRARAVACCLVVSRMPSAWPQLVSRVEPDTAELLQS